MCRQPRQESTDLYQDPRYDDDLRRLKSYVVLLYDLYKPAKVPNKADTYYRTYIRVNGLYRKRVGEAKKKHNVKLIKSSPNMCKAAWDIINIHRTKKPVDLPEYVPDEFNKFFVDSVEEIISNLPVVPSNSVAATVHHHPDRPRLVDWNVVSPCQIVKIVSRFKNSRNQDVYGVSCSI
ncbi:hypothetical protein J6590_037582 [Homalodisca vitripennis]|nr:hypothetical protein J6590_037582 [Homalodisca vitripennis]